jgi:hypothetical protein
MSRRWKIGVSGCQRSPRSFSDVLGSKTSQRHLGRTGASPFSLPAPKRYRDSYRDCWWSCSNQARTRWYRQLWWVWVRAGLDQEKKPNTTRFVRSNGRTNGFALPIYRNRPMKAKRVWWQPLLRENFVKGARGKELWFNAAPCMQMGKDRET